HQFEFVVALQHAAARGHRRSAADLELRRGFCDAIAEDVADGFFHAERSNIEVLQSLGQELVGTLVLLPRADVGILAIRGAGQLLPRAPFLKSRAYAECATLGR